MLLTSTSHPFIPTFSLVKSVSPAGFRPRQSIVNETAVASSGVGTNQQIDSLLRVYVYVDTYVRTLMLGYVVK